MTKFNVLPPRSASNPSSHPHKSLVYKQIGLVTLVKSGRGSCGCESKAAAAKTKAAAAQAMAAAAQAKAAAVKASPKVKAAAAAKAKASLDIPSKHHWVTSRPLC